MTSTAPLILALSMASQAPAGPFVSEEGGFRVALPGKPEEQVQELQTPLRPVQLHLFGVQAGPTHYAAAFVDYPTEIALADPQRVLEGGVEGALKNTRSKLLVKKPITLAGHPGREIEADGPPRGGAAVLYRARFYMVEARLYQVILVGPPASVEGEAGAKFLDSFALLRPPPPPKPVEPLARGKAFSSEAGGFRVRFPEAPRERVQPAGEPAGSIQIHFFVVDRGDVAYFVIYNDYAPDAVIADVDEALDGAVRGAVQGNKGATLIGRREVRLGPIPGRAYEADLKLPDGQPGICRGRVYLDGNRLYQVLFVAARPKDDPKAAEAFLDSFAKLRPPTP